VAIGVLIAQGRLPKPEVAVIADTGREDPRTWEYLREHMQPLLGTVGVTVEIAPRSLAACDLYDRQGKALLMPVFTPTGKFTTRCSTEWKRDVVWRYLRSKGYGPKRPILQWMGFSLDEKHRAKPSGRKWTVNRFPLLFDVPLTRHECKNLVMAAGLPEPPKSSCIMCPHRRNAQWRDLRDHAPEQFREAVQLEHAISAADSQGGVFLHRDLVPLDQVDLSDDRPEEEALLWDAAQCDSGYCFV
jgi:hypothetical protein